MQTWFLVHSPAVQALQFRCTSKQVAKATCPPFDLALLPVAQLTQERLLLSACNMAFIAAQKPGVHVGLVVIPCAETQQLSSQRFRS